MINGKKIQVGCASVSREVYTVYKCIIFWENKYILGKIVFCSLSPLPIHREITLNFFVLDRYQTVAFLSGQAKKMNK